MALEAVTFPQTQIGNFLDYHLLQEDQFNFNGEVLDHDQFHYNVYWGDCYNSSSPVMQLQDTVDYCGSKSSPEDYNTTGGEVKMESSLPAAAVGVATTTGGTAGGRRKRRRKQSGKNKEELENQRMTHITVERNRRKLMNEYLGVIRSLMPTSYVQRGDQASIVGGAINFVKELEQQLHTLEGLKRANFNGSSSPPPPHPFSNFFTFPQYSILQEASDGPTTMAKNRPPAMAEIEVTIVESQANLKILSKKRHGQLLKLVTGLKSVWLTVLHLNVTTVEEMVLYTISVKLDDGCQLSKVDEIADAVNCLLGRIEGESLCSN